MSKTLELLKTYNNTTTLIREWYLNKMIESFKDKDVPEDFKEMMRAVPIDNDKISKMVDGAPRLLFDFFDENEVFIQINVNNFGKVYSYSINEGESMSGGWTCRKDAEYASIERAFEILENKIKETQQ